MYNWLKHVTVQNISMKKEKLKPNDSVQDTWNSDFL